MSKKKNRDSETPEQREKRLAKRREVMKRHYQRNKATVKARVKRWGKENPEAVAGYQANWRKENREQRRIKQRERRALDPAFRLRQTLSLRTRLALRSKSVSIIALTGCTPSELKTHIEALFWPGMSWEHRSEWHLDHIIPLVSFDLDDPAQQLQACHFSNLQPLWYDDNAAKGERLDWSPSESKHPLPQRLAA